MVSILGANSASGGYEVSNSLRFNDGDSPYLRKSFGSGGDRRTFTWSGWVKPSKLGSIQVLFSSNSEGQIRFQGDGSIMILHTGESQLITNALFRDPAAWYHIVVAFDSGQGTSSNRVKLYVNGVQITSFTTTQYPDQNTDFPFNANENHDLGKRASATSFYYGGYMTEVHFIDGSAKAPTDFGEFDDNGVWIPKEYDGSYGTTGFYLEFKQTGTSQNSSGIGADTSGNDNHFAVTNLAATDITEDTCTNNFATMNPLESDRQQGGAATFAEGNLQITTSYVDANYQRYPQVYSTQAASSGKWYFEMKIADSDTDSAMGIHSPDNYSSDSTTNPYGGYATTSCIYTSRGAVRINDGNNTGHGTWSQNDIIGCALDIDNSKVYFHKNGTYIQSGDPAGNSGGQAIPSGYTYGFTVGADAASDSGIMQVNFGNPIHTISSGNTDGKYGNFEYAVPSGFYALCTKRLAEFG
jgi:hypothetical protein